MTAEEIMAGTSAATRPAPDGLTSLAANAAAEAAPTEDNELPPTARWTDRLASLIPSASSSSSLPPLASTTSPSPNVTPGLIPNGPHTPPSSLPDQYPAQASSPNLLPTPYPSPPPSTSSSSPFEPIAIIGMGMRLPGSVTSSTTFWDLLINKRSGRCRVPTSKYNISTWGPSPSTQGQNQLFHVASSHGYFLSPETNLSKMDAGFWSVSRHEAETMDPQQRLFLEVAYEALESGGVAGKLFGSGKDIGVYVGQMGDDWTEMERSDPLNLGTVRAEVYGDYIVANRASYEFNFTGPSMVVRTACSSSLVALHLACQDIHGGACSSALVGGVNLVTSHRDSVVMAQHSVLSPRGECRSFDADADGFGRGEGVSAIYIKKLSDAVRDGDPVRAVIRSTCVSNDGRTQGITLPDPKSHERLMLKAYSLAGISDEEVKRTAMVECHGTGTPIGDPIEVGAVANIWGKDGILIGSVKPNIGHGEGASGISSVIKMVLALERLTIPPNINFKTPNPRIPWKEAKLTVPVEPMPWPRDRLERVSVNGFGIAGTNAHVILESAAAAGASRSTDTEEEEGRGPEESPQLPRLLVFSAKHSDSLYRSVDTIRSYMSHNPSANLHDISHTLATGRFHHRPHRAFAVMSPPSTFELSSSAPSSSSSSASSATAPIVWVFTGQGAQWARMGASLLQHSPLVRHRIAHLSSLMATLSDASPWSLEDAILAPASTSRLNEAEVSQPCLAALQIALVDLLRSWGLHPHAVLGHSSGETPAAYAAGYLSAEDAFLMAYHRGKVTVPLKEMHRGGMAAVGMGAVEVQGYLREGVIVGCDNSPESVTLSGEAEVLDSVMDAIKAARPEVLCRKLLVECGYHSPQMWAVMPLFHARTTGPEDGLSAAAVEGLRDGPPKVPFYSTVSAQLETDLSLAHFEKNMVSPVLFDGAVRAAVRDLPGATFVEIGPHSAFAGPIRQIMASMGNSTASYVPTLVRGKDALESVLRTAGTLWSAGQDIDVGAVVKEYGDQDRLGRLLTDLPTYQWRYTEDHWLESRISREWRNMKHRHHEILGARVPETGDGAPAWRCKLRLEDVPWLRNHAFDGRTLFPASAYIAMVGVAVRQLASGLAGGGSSSSSPQADFSLKDIAFLAPLALTDDDAVEVVTSLTPRNQHSATPILEEEEGGEGMWYDFAISSIPCYGSDVWTRHVTGRCRAGSDLTPVADAETLAIASGGTILPRKVNATSFYNTLHQRGLQYGGRFRGMSNASADVTPNKMQGVSSVETWCSPEEKAYYPTLHPAVVDASFHVHIVAACRGLERNFESVSVPTFVEEVYLREIPRGDAMAAEGLPAPYRVVAEVGRNAQGRETSSLTGICGDSVVLRVRGLEVSPLSKNGGLGRPANRLSEVEADDPHAGAKIEWKADIDFVDAASLIRPLTDNVRVKLLEAFVDGVVQGGDEDMMAALAIDVLSSLGTSHLLPIARAIADKALRARNGRIGTDKAEGDPMQVDSEDAMVLDEAATNESSPASLEGDSSTLTLSRAYDAIASSDIDHSDLLALLGHKNPRMRILEIAVAGGGDDGRMASTVLQGLRSPRGDLLYGTYVYAAASEAEFASAKTRLGSIKGIRYAVLNPAQDPVSQGFEESSFDLIISSSLRPGSLPSCRMPFGAAAAAQVILATSKKLLGSRGRLLVRSLNRSSPVVEFLLGDEHQPCSAATDVHDASTPTPPGTTSPAGATEAAWRDILNLTGFAGDSATICIGGLSTTILVQPAPTPTSDPAFPSPLFPSPLFHLTPPPSRPPAVQSNQNPSLRISILTLNSSHPTIASVTSFLRSAGGYAIDWFIVGQTLPATQPCVCLLDLEGTPFLDSDKLTPALWVAFKTSVLSLQDDEGVSWTGGRMLWVTGSAQVQRVGGALTDDPRFALSLGAARTIRRETAVDLVTLELDRFDEMGWEGVVMLLRGFEERKGAVGVDRDLDPDMEYVWSRGEMLISRIFGVQVLAELRGKQVSDGARTALVIETRGDVSSLGWRQVDGTDHQRILRGDEVEIDVRFVDLTAHDRDIALPRRGGVALIQPDAGAGAGQAGLKGAGVVSRVGSDVKGFGVGSRVMFCHEASLATSLTLQETSCVEIPAGLEMEEAAAMPSSYVTALYGLAEVARLERGQSVLIHDVSDPVGLAALNLAHHIGAKIFCTVAAVDDFVGMYDSLAAHGHSVYISKNDTWKHDILATTRGRGVHVVVVGTSNSDYLLDASWNCVAPFGHVIHIGDGGLGSSRGRNSRLMDPGSLGLNLTFTTVNISQLVRHRPDLCARLIAKSFELVNDQDGSGLVVPLDLGPVVGGIKTVDAAQIEDVFSTTTHQNHQPTHQIQHIVVRLPDDNANTSRSSLKTLTVTHRRKMALRADRTYIIVGGVGGLGLATGRFLIERGARSLIFFSRSAASFAERNPHFAAEFSAMGCRAHFISGSVSSASDVARMVSSVECPAAGVIHAAMVLQDSHLTDMTFAQWQACVEPKVQGTWNLHYALLESGHEDLDFFVLFSSLSGVGGQIGQANYAAANAFLDAFVQYRRSRGLAASVVDIGIMEEIGVLSRNKKRLDALRGTSLHFLHERELLDAVELMILEGGVPERRGSGNDDGATVGRGERTVTGTGTAAGFVSNAQLAIGLRSSPSLLSQSSSSAAGPGMGRSGWQSDPRVIFRRNVDVAIAPSSSSSGPSSSRTSSDVSLKDFLARCQNDPGILETPEAVSRLGQAIGATLSRFMMRVSGSGDDASEDDVDLGASLGSLGVDSLVSVELRTWLRQKVGVAVSVQEIRGAQSLGALAALAAEKMLVRLLQG